MLERQELEGAHCGALSKSVDMECRSLHATFLRAVCQVVTPKACNLCVVVGGAARPPHIPEQARCVREEWLLLAAERFELPDKEEFLLE
jgi:hypothetical protein